MQVSDLREHQERRDIGNIFNEEALREAQERRIIDRPIVTNYNHEKIRQDILNIDPSQEMSEDDAERMIKLYYASELNRGGDQRTPDEHDYDALVHSQHGENAPQMKKSDVFKTMRQSIIPERDPEHFAYMDFMALSDEEKWEKIKPSATEARTIRSSPFAFSTGFEVQAKEYTDDEKSAMISKHARKLLYSSDFNIKLLAKKHMSKRVQKVAFDIANGVNRESMALSFASPATASTAS